MISPLTVEYLLLSSTSSSQSRMYLIILLSVSLWRLFGSCYLFAVETPQGSIQLIRDCCSVNSPLTSSGWAWLLFKRDSFVLSLSSNRRATDSPGGGLMALLYAPHHTRWSFQSWQSLAAVFMPSEAEEKRENKTVGMVLKKRCTVLSCSTLGKWGW